jgi:hypothetical protein
MSQSSVTLSIGPAPHPAGLPGEGQSSCVKIRERTLRGTRFRARISASASQVTASPTPNSGAAGAAACASEAGLRGDAPRRWEQLRGCTRAETQLGHSCRLSCPIRSGFERQHAVWPSSRGLTRAGRSEATKPPEDKADGPTQWVWFAGRGANAVPYSGLGCNAACPRLGSAIKGQGKHRAGTGSWGLFPPDSNFSLNFAAWRRSPCVPRAHWGGTRAWRGPGPRGSASSSRASPYRPHPARSAPTAWQRQGCAPPPLGSGSAAGALEEQPRQAARRAVPAPAASGAPRTQRPERARRIAQHELRRGAHANRSLASGARGPALREDRGLDAARSG